MANDTDLTAANYVLFVGCGVSVTSLLLTLIVYIANGYLRVKRQNMITINLLISLLVFYVGFIISLSSDIKRNQLHHHDDEHEGANETEEEEEKKFSPDCVAGSILLLFGWFYVHSWLLAHWIFLSLRIQRSAPRHISSFFVKICLGVYIPSSIAPIIIVAYDGSRDHVLISQDHCFFNLGKMGLGIGFGLLTAINFGLVVGCSIFCIARLTCCRNPVAVQSTLTKNRGSLIRLCFLSLIILVTHIPHLVMWVVDNHNHEIESVQTLEVTVGIFVGVHGILIVICLLYRGNRFCIYWSSAVLGHNPVTDISVSHSRATKLSNRVLSSNTSEMYVEDSPPSIEQRLEPRDARSVALTEDDEVFFATSPSKAKNGDAKISNQDTGRSNDIPKLESFRQKVLRNSFQKSNKPNVGPATNNNKDTTNRSATLDRSKHRNSPITAENAPTGDLERKSSF